MKTIIKKTGKVTKNVYCGSVTGAGKRVSGCGAKPKDFTEYWTDAGHGCFSTVSLCTKCEKKVGVK